MLCISLKSTGTYFGREIKIERYFKYSRCRLYDRLRFSLYKSTMAIWMFSLSFTISFNCHISTWGQNMLPSWLYLLFFSFHQKDNNDAFSHTSPTHSFSHCVVSATSLGNKHRLQLTHFGDFLDALLHH